MADKMKKEYENIISLIKDNLSNSETDEAIKLIKELSDVKRKGFLTKKQFYDVAMWKTPRPKNHYLNNSEDSVKQISKKAMKALSEEEKIMYLTLLKGVSIPVASSLLTIAYPKNYGIIDIRVWQLLYSYDEVKTKPGGQGFNMKDWLTYISTLRRYAVECNSGVRDIERTLFFYHKKIQIGKLYTVKETQHI